MLLAGDKRLRPIGGSKVPRKIGGIGVCLAQDLHSVAGGALAGGGAD
jgi:hypothetical protein